MASTRGTVVRHASTLGSWEMVRADPAPALAGHVRSYCGYREDAAGPMRRTEVPSGSVGLILSLGPEITVRHPAGGPGPARRRTSFVAGLHEEHAVTEYSGAQHGVQVDLAPPVASMLLGLPMGELRGQVTDLGDVLGRAGDELVERLHDAPDWDARFAILDAVLARRLAEARRLAPEVLGAWARLSATHGAMPVDVLARECGWSRRHLAACFREQIGLPPKAFARILRFQRVTSLLNGDDSMGLAEIAYACGYADQSHLNRDFRAFAGTTPTDLLARRLPDGGGVAAQVAFVQDVAGSRA